MFHLIVHSHRYYFSRHQHNRLRQEHIQVAQKLRTLEDVAVCLSGTNHEDLPLQVQTMFLMGR